MASRVVIALLVFAGLTVAYYHVDRALETLRVHAPDPEATSKVGNVYKRQIDIVCTDMLPRLQPPASAVRRALICEHYGKLVPALFLIAALTGWCASVWLLAIQGKSEVIAESWVAFLASFLLAIVAGVASLLILKGPLALFQIENPRLESAVALPLLAGLFLRTFFDRLPEVLRSYMDKLTGKAKGK